MSGALNAVLDAEKPGAWELVAVNFVCAFDDCEWGSEDVSTDAHRLREEALTSGDIAYSPFDAWEEDDPE